MDPSLNLKVFIGLVAGGVFLEAIFSKLYYLATKKEYRKHHFAVSRYVYLLLFPFIATGVIILNVGFHLINIFIAFAMVGTIIEWLIGYSYYTIVGQKLWTYHKYSIGTYTSWLSVPFWGLGGILFWLIVQVLG